MSRRVMVAAMMLAASACTTTTTGGGGVAGGGGGGGGGAAIPIEQLPAAVKTNFCKIAVDCNLDESFFRFSSVAVCEEFLTASGEFEAEIGMMVAKIQSGKVIYDANKAGACLAAQKASCDIDSEPEACKGITVGTVAVDGACDDDIECQPGSFCHRPKEGCPGACKTTAKLNDACGDDVRCEGDLTCSGEAGAQTCVEDKPAAEAESCAEKGCADGLFCDQAATCAKRGAEGADCNDEDECQKGLRCDGETSKCGQPLAADAPCKTSGQYECASGLACSIIGKYSDGKLQCLPEATVGQPCKSHQQCAAIDLHCKGLGGGSAEGTCSPLPRLGESCEPFSLDNPQFLACFLGSTCDKATKKCVGPAKEGQSCADGRECEKGLWCDDEDGGSETCIKPPTTTPSCD